MKIQLKRSEVTNSGSAKEPTAAQMEYGELAVNYSDEDPAIFLKNKSNEIIRIAGAGANGNIEIPESGSGPHQPGTSDDRYIEVTGDNMTGNLTLGTDKITLNATAGTIAATDTVAVASSFNADTFSNVNANGLICQNPISSSNDIFFRGRTSAGDNKVDLYTDGSASFSGEVIANGTKVRNPVDSGLNLVANSYGGTTGNYWGYVQVSGNGTPNATLSSNGVFQVLDRDSGTYPARIFADGSATFAGDVNVGDNKIFGSWGIQVDSGTAASGTALNVINNGASTAVINADGSASFASSIFAGSTVSVNRNISDGSAAFYVENPASGIVTRLNCNGSASFAGELLVTVPSASRAFQISDTGGGSAASMYGNGNATFNGTVTATVVPPSDARFKENIEPAKPQLADVVALGGLLKNYDWNDDAPLNEEIRSQRQLGLIAQEAAEVCPTIVKDIHRTKTVEVTPAVKGPKDTVIKEAITKEEDDSYKGISQDALIMKLIGAVTELSAEVEALKAAK